MTRATRALRAIFVATLVAGAACSKKPAADARDSATPAAPDAKHAAISLGADQREHVRVVPVAAASYRPTIQTTGTVAFDGNISTQVLAPISGPVVRLLVEVGAEVHRGDPLAVISSPDFAAAVAAYRKAQAAAAQTEKVAALNAELFKADGIARRDFEQSQVDAESAGADRDAALQELRSLGVDSASIAALREGKQAGPVVAYLRAPLSGTVVERLITPGQLLQAGTTPCFTVADLSRMWVLASVFESDLAFVAAGDRARISGSALPRPLDGRAQYVAALVDPATRATTVRVEVPNEGRLLKRDMYVEVAIQSTRTTTGVLVPVSAVLRDEDNLPFVFVQTGDSLFARRPLTLGGRIGDRFEVRTGLKAGERVIAEGGLFLEFAQNQ